MLAALLATKLFIPPPRPGVVYCARLNERLDAGLHRKLTLISAPPGFGKTTLASTWASRLSGGSGSRPPEGPVRVAWLALDESDNDPLRFLAYLVAALQKAAPEAGERTLALLRSPQPLPPEPVLTELLNDLAGLPDKILLVLDDYHTVVADPIHQAVTYLLEQAPPQLHLVIASREDPPLPMARLRAKDQLTELHAADLRFSLAEAAEFFNQSMGLDLSMEEVANLERRTEGWIAGLQLAALALQGPAQVGSRDPGGLPRAFSGSHRFVLDYLVEEVLQRQSEAVRSFLLQTALLDRLCGPLCEAVTGGEGGRELLHALERGNLFVFPLDDRREWYRYHHLFAEALQARLEQEQPGLAPRLHSRASRWYEQNGLLVEAIRHALAAQDWERAAGLLELAWPETENGRLSPAAWLGWATALPGGMVRGRPGLSFGCAWALLGRGNLEAAAAHLDDAERGLKAAEPSPGEAETLAAGIAIARAYIAQSLGDLPASIRHARQVLEILPEGDHPQRDRATALLGLSYWANGDLLAADETFAAYTRKLSAVGNLTDAISTSFVLAEIRLGLGRLRQALSTLEACLQSVLAQDGPVHPDAAELYRGLAELHHERGDLPGAAEYLHRCQELGEQAGVLDWQRRLYIAQARLKRSQGDLSAALDLLERAEQVHIRTPLPDLRPIPALRARIWAAQGRLAEAWAWAQEAGLAVDDEPVYRREFEHLTLARVLLAEVQPERAAAARRAALGLLARLQQAAEAGGRLGSLIKILILQALAHQAGGDLPAARAALERSLQLAEPEGYVRIFVDEGPPLARLLHETRAGGEMEGYVRRLLAGFAHPGSAADGERRVERREERREERRVEQRVEPLSEREREVLQHLAAGQANGEIAARLHLSLHTVKVHTRNIYAKLGVHNRTQAAAAGRALGILDDPPAG